MENVSYGLASHHFLSVPIFGNIQGILHWVSSSVRGTFWVRYVICASHFVPTQARCILLAEGKLTLYTFAPAMNVSAQMSPLLVQNFSLIPFLLLK